MKSLKLVGILSTASVIGGVSTLAVLATSCGEGPKDTAVDFGTWEYNMAGQMPTQWPENIADAIAGYDIVLVILYPWDDYNSIGAMYYMEGITQNDDYELPYMYSNPAEEGFNFYSGQPGIYNLKVIVANLPLGIKLNYLGTFEVLISNHV